MTKMQEKAVVVFSGGQDSTYCLANAAAQGVEVHAVTFNYGQRHAIEIEAAKNVFALLQSYWPNIVDHEICDVGPILKGSSPLVSGNELEQYADFNSLPGGLEKTFVPMRNQLFLTLAANRAAVKGARYLVTGVCEEDYGGYPDCRQVFIDKLQAACNTGTFTGEDGAPEPLQIITPLMHLTKRGTVHAAMNFSGCYAATAFSHTAYDGQYPPLGNDHATLLRAKGFFEANIPDPLILRAYAEGLMALPDAANYAEDIVEQYLPAVNEAMEWLKEYRRG